MSMTAQPPTQPAKLGFDLAAGLLRGHTDRYEKRLGELAGLYLDQAAFGQRVASHGAGELVYWVESSDTQHDAGGLITGLTCMQPGCIGGEYFMTRGHLHRDAGCGELYCCLAGRGVMLLETLDGATQAVEMTTGEAVYVPGGWVHRSVNVGDTPLTMLFCYPALAGQDYAVIGAAGGMSQRIVRDGGGWRAVPNPTHTGYRAAS